MVEGGENKAEKGESRKQKWPGRKWQMANGRWKRPCGRRRCPARTAVLPGRGNCPHPFYPLSVPERGNDFLDRDPRVPLRCRSVLGYYRSPPPGLRDGRLIPVCLASGLGA